MGGVWRGVTLPVPSKCVHFAEPKQQIMYVHICPLTCEHLCKHLQHGKRMRMLGHRQNVLLHLQSVPEAGRAQSKNRQWAGLCGPGAASMHVVWAQGRGLVCHQAGRASLLR